jgi:hypothetical protein
MLRAAPGKIAGVLTLGVQRVGGDDRAVDLDAVQQRGEYADFAGLGIHLCLAQHHAVRMVGADAFMISAPQALREFVFTGRESSIRFSQAPSRLVRRDWIVITGQASDGQVQLAITKKAGLPEIWQALAGTGAAQDWGPAG